MSKTSQPARVPSSSSPPSANRLEVRLPELHDIQRQVFESAARFKVVAAGRQVGKTLLGTVTALATALRGGRVWWVAPTFPIGELGWMVLEHLAHQIPGTRFEGRPVYRITFSTGGSIQMRSSDNPNSLRGATLDGVVFDEAAQAKEEAWPILRPTLAVRRGWALFISTPRGENWFHDLFAAAPDRPGWERWQFPSAASPYITQEDIELARADMSSLYFSQEYEAEFVSGASGQFHADWFQSYRVEWDGEERLFILGGEGHVVPLSACWTFHTVDLAWTTDERADYTVISSWAVTPRSHLLWLDMKRARYEAPDIVPALRLAYETWGGYLAVERANRASIIAEAERTGLPVRELRADRKKELRAMPAAARMEQGRIWFPPPSTPWLPEAQGELLAFPAGRHDDIVDSLAYAVLEVAAAGSAYSDHGLVVL